MSDPPEARPVTDLEVGGRTGMEPVSVDGYSFAVFEDPEMNTVGIVLLFQTA